MTNQQEYIRLCSIPAVQEKIREGLGPTKIGDRVSHAAEGVGVVVEIHSSYGTLWLTIWFEDKKYNLTYAADSSLLIRLPQVHDLNDEKRGLWSWVDWGFWTVTVHNDGDLEFENICDGTVIIATPELALLRALMHQWAIEEELADYKAANASIREELRCRIKERDKLEAERDALKAGNERMREALRYIAFTIPGPTMKTHAEAAQQALQGGGNESL